MINKYPKPDFTQFDNTDLEYAFKVPYSVFYNRKRKTKCHSFRPAIETQRVIEANKHRKQKR